MMKPPTDALSIDVAARDDRFRAGPREAWLRNLAVAAGLAGAVGAIALLGGKARLHAPDLALLARQPLVLQIHFCAALLALLVGLVLMTGAKGTTLHRVLGWTWSIAMVVVAGVSFGLPSVWERGFSPIHLLSAFVLVMVPLGVYAARRHDIRAHRIRMTNTFLFGLIVAGAFTLFPGRLMWRVFFG